MNVSADGEPEQMVIPYKKEKNEKSRTVQKKSKLQTNANRLKKRIIKKLKIVRPFKKIER